MERGGDRAADFGYVSVAGVPGEIDSQWPGGWAGDICAGAGEDERRGRWGDPGGWIGGGGCGVSGDCGSSAGGQAADVADGVSQWECLGEWDAGGIAVSVARDYALA